ncbi:hypothetical protein ES703_116500 [subsurface metagenome]
MKTIMKQLITIKSIPVLALVLLVVLGSSFVKGTGQDPEPRPVYHAAIYLYSVEADIAAIKECGDLYALALNTGDLELWLSLHTDDIVKMGPDAPSVLGLEELRAGMEPAFDNFTFEMTINTEEVQVAGDWAFARGTYTFSMTPKAGGETISVMPDGKFLTIWKRQADGSWKASHDCYNSNVPPPQ